MKTTNMFEQEDTVKYQGTQPTKVLQAFPGKYFSIRLKIRPYSGNTITFSYQSDPYPCPYPEDYNDVAGIFEPCYHVICPPMFMLSKGKCICKVGLVILEDGSCGCPPGTAWKINRCVKVEACPFGFVLRRGQCICPPRKVINKKGRCVRRP